MKTTLLAGLLTVGAALCATAAPAQVTKIASNPPARILTGVKVAAGTELLFLSGQLPSPVDPAKKPADIKSVDDYGDSKTQTISTLNKIKGLLEAQGYTMADVIKMTLFITADPKTGKMDFAGVNEGFGQFYNTTENPTTVARSAIQVAGLAGPYFLIEIEAIAAKKK